MRRFLIASLCLLGLWQTPSLVRGDLKPDEIAILAIRDSRESKAVAAYYAKTRAVPTSQVMLLDIPAGEQISREDWETKVRPAVRQWLTDKKLLQKIRCFVTVWDVPLKIQAVQANPDAERLRRYLTAERQARVARLSDYLATLPTRESNADSSSLPLAGDAKQEDIRAILDPMFSYAQGEALKITNEERKKGAQQQLQLVYFRAVGFNMMLNSLAQQMQNSPAPDPKLRQEFDLARGRTIGLSQGRAALEGMPIGLQREPQLLALIELSDGVFGTIAWIDDQLAMLQKNETYASFDSELSLVAWPDYETIRWQPNYLHYRFDGSPIRSFYKTFMVSRLEAPSLQITRDLIDRAVEVEKQGLQGKVYLDARGLAKLGQQVAPNTYADYDQTLLKAEAMIRQHTDLDVVLDTEQELFADGSCPEAALYCGWYSLAKYRDAFQWQPGAIGYHMASGEATTLRRRTARCGASECWRMV